MIQHLTLHGWADLAQRTLGGVSELALSWTFISNVSFKSYRSNAAAVTYTVVVLTCHGDNQTLRGSTA